MGVARWWTLVWSCWLVGCAAAPSVSADAGPTEDAGADAGAPSSGLLDGGGVHASGCWATPVALTAAGPYFPSFELAAGSGEQVFAAWLQDDVPNGGILNAFASRSLPDGGWAPARRLLPDPRRSLRDVSGISLAANAGRAAVVWAELFDAPDGGMSGALHLARYLEAADWLPLEQVTTDPDAIVMGTPVVAIDETGVITVVWLQIVEWGSRPVKLLSRRLTAAGWEAPVQISDPAVTVYWWAQPSLSVAGTNTVVFWSQNDQFQMATQGSAGWRRENLASSVGYFPAIQGAVDAQGRALASWASDSNEVATVAVKLSGGWQAPLLLSARFSGAAPRSVAMDAAGRGAVVFWGLRADFSEAMYLTRFDGVSIQPPIELSGQQFTVVRGRLAMNTSGAALATWQAPDPEVLKLFAARFDSSSKQLEVDTIDGLALLTSRAAVSPKGVRWVSFFGPGPSASQALVPLVSHCP